MKLADFEKSLKAESPKLFKVVKGKQVRLTDDEYSFAIKEKARALYEASQAESSKQQNVIDFNKAVEAGYPVSEGFSLGIDEDDRKAWTELVTMFQEGIQLGKLTDKTPVTIKDVEGKTQTVTVKRCREIIFELGMYYKSLWNNLNK